MGDFSPKKKPKDIDSLELLASNLYEYDVSKFNIHKNSDWQDFTRKVS